LPRFSFSKMRPIAVGERRRKEERGRQRRAQHCKILLAIYSPFVQKVL